MGGPQMAIVAPEALSELEEALATFVHYYNYSWYHKALGNVTHLAVR